MNDTILPPFNGMIAFRARMLVGVREVAKPAALDMNMSPVRFPPPHEAVRALSAEFALG